MKKETFFYFFNIFLLYLMIFFVYYPRNVKKINLPLAIVYIVIIFAFLVFGWFKVRRFTVSTYLLIILQIGLILHFLGGIVFGSQRLYEQIILGIRYDKLVHMYNSFAGFIGLKFLVNKLKFKLHRYENLTVVLLTLSLGTVIELIEYLGIKTLPTSYSAWNVNSLQPLYDNNMQDLAADLIGAMLGWLSTSLFHKKKS